MNGDLFFVAAWVLVGGVLHSCYDLAPRRVVTQVRHFLHFILQNKYFFEHNIRNHKVKITTLSFTLDSKLANSHDNPCRINYDRLTFGLAEKVSVPQTSNVSGACCRIWEILCVYCDHIVVKHWPDLYRLSPMEIFTPSVTIEWKREQRRVSAFLAFFKWHSNQLVSGMQYWWFCWGGIVWLL